MKPRIITLGNNTRIGKVIAFDDAFDDYSEASGSRKAKRAERKSEKRALKTKRKVERIQSHAEVQQARIQKRADTQSMLQGKRTNKVAAKIGRKTLRKDFRHPASTVPPSTEDQGEILTDNTGQPYDETRNQPPVFEEQYQNGQDDNGSTGTDYGTSSGQNWEGNPPNMEEEEVEETGEENPDGEMESTEASDEIADDDTLDYSFSGILGASDYYYRLTDNNKKVVEITPELEGVATKIEWHKENLSRLRVQRAKNLGLGIYTGDIEEKMRDSIQRISDLENILHKYANFEGDIVMGEDKKPSLVPHEKPKNPDKKAKKLRYYQVGKAQAIGRNKREAYLVKKQNNQPGQTNGGDVTMVDVELNPKFSPQQIVVPAETSNASGTGLVGLDDINDFDAPPIRKVEITSNASGTTGSEKPNYKPLVIGLVIGLAVVAIWGVNGKYKLIR